MKRHCVRPPAGLLLWARRRGDIDRLRAVPRCQRTYIADRKLILNVLYTRDKVK